ncbi:MAG: tetratricopeptide repeat protein [Polyangiales bacterium]
MRDTHVDRPDPLVGARVGARYRVVRELGGGGMAVVYEGEHEDLGRRVAIKVIRHELVAAAPDAVERFLQEARTASSLQHPSIVDVFDLGRLEDGRPFMVMPLLKGVDLERMLSERGPRSPREVARLLAGPAAALDAMHAQGIVHRDIKLENLFLERHDDGHESVRLMDFGLAAMSGHGSRMTRDGMVLGTPHYMAPEVARGDKAKASADIYGLATVAYELISGVLPFDDDEPVRLMATKLVHDAPRLSTHLEVEPGVDDLFARALARDPEKRPKSCGELLDALARVAGARPATAETDALFEGPSPAERRVDEPKKGRGVAAAVAVVLLLGVGGVSWWTLRGSDADPAVAAAATETAPATEPVLERAAEPIEVAEAAPAEPASEPTAVPTVEPTAVPTVQATAVPTVEPTAEPTPRGRVARAPRETPVAAAEPPTMARAPEPEPEPTAMRGPDLERARALNDEANGLALRGLLPAAVDRYREATLIAPRLAAPWRGLGITHERLRQTAEARRAFERYLQLAPNAPDAERIRTRLEAMN